MTTLTMKVIEASAHPNADALRVYQFAADPVGTVQVVANMDNVYEVNDVAIVVLSGAVLKDGTKINSCKLRGVPSYGMALGKTNESVGTDLTSEYERPIITKRGVNVVKWAEIESLYNVRRALKQMDSEDRKISYKGKIKLDGTNSGVLLFPDGRIVPQSRTRIIDPDDDNIGFAKWTVSMYNYFSEVRKLADEQGYKDQLVTIFSEWSGRGIQKRTAISKIDRKIIAVFAVQIGSDKLDINPNSIRKLFPEHNDVFVIPWLDNSYLFLDFSDRDQLEKQAEKINQLIDQIEQRDPWVYETFGVNGIGEGVVMYPIIPKPPSGGPDAPIIVDRLEFSELVFKAKGEKHKVVKTKKAVQIDPEIAQNIEQFVSLFVTEPRLEQIAGQVGVENRKTGDFLKSFCGDVKKESTAELEASKLEWKQVSKAVSTAARNWYIHKCQEL